jgi:hypothetical protein
LVSKTYAGLLIGKGGVTVKRLTKESGCRNINFGDGCLPGTELQLMVMRGYADRITDGVTRMCEMIAKFALRMKDKGEPVSKLQDGHVELKMCFQDEVVPKIIGKKGAQIKMLQSASYSKMRFAGDKMDGEQFLTIRGTPIAVADAVNMTLRCLEPESFLGERPGFKTAGMDKEEKSVPAPMSPSSRPAPAYASRRASYDAFDSYPDYDAAGRMDYDYPPASRYADSYDAPRESYGARRTPAAAAAPPADRGMDVIMAKQQELERAMAANKALMASRMTYPRARESIW